MKTEPFLYWLIVSLMVLALLMYLCRPSKILPRNSRTPATQLNAAAGHTEGRSLVWNKGANPRGMSESRSMGSYVHVMAALARCGKKNAPRPSRPTEEIQIQQFKSVYPY